MRNLEDIKFRAKRIDVSGHVIGNVTVVSFSHIDNGGNSVWLCRCTCGKEYTISYSNLKRCAGTGCLKCKNNYLRIKKTIHGMADTRIHNIWMHMINRCNKHFDRSYAYYGARGITVCKEWRDFLPFYNWSMNNGYRKSLTIDRIDVNGNYEPSNCRWVDMKIQNNNRRDNKRFVIDDTEHTLSEWCDIFNINYSLVKGRLRRGVKLDIALTAQKQRPFGFRNIHNNPNLLKPQQL